MSICPFAVQQIIPESHTQGRITPTTLIYHRAVSSAESLQNYWNSPGVELESHFYIGQFGTLYQFMDTNVRADANVDANGFAISVETWDGGNTPDSMGWNPAQLATAKRLAAWVCETHGVKRAAAQTWNGGGIGGHNWFPYPWAGGPRGCPGTERNRQIRGEIIPFVANGGGSSIEEDDMYTDEDRRKAGLVHDAIYLTANPVGQTLFDATWDVKRLVEQGNAAVLAAVAASTSDSDITLERLQGAIVTAVTQANETTISQVGQIVRSVLGQDNEELADLLLDKIGRALVAAPDAA
jgi:hypothetical protein